MLFFSTVAVWLFAVCKSEIEHLPHCELRDAYGYDNINNANDYHDWVLAKGPSTFDSLTGPSSNHANDGGCYLLHKTTKANPEEFSLLVSSCYTKLNTLNDQPVLRFFHYTYGRDLGSLQVHLLRHDCLQPSSLDANTMVDHFVNEENKIWEVIGSQSDSWTRAEINLDVSFPAFPFQIVFKAVVGNGSLSDIALDEISINGIECYLDSSFLCDHGNCIPKDFVCDDDGFLDCIDETDEPAPGCCNPFTEFQCMTTGRCIDIEKRCNGVTWDCAADDMDNSDEINCTDGQITSNTNTEYSSLSTTYPGGEITEVTPLLDFTEASESEKHPLTFATSTYYTSDNPNIFIVNNAETFCQKDSIVSGFNNCSFIGIVVAFGAIAIVLAALVITRIFNRCSRSPQKRKSIAASETKNSLVPDYSLSLDNLETGQDNKTADCDTKNEIVKSHKYEIVNDGITPPTASKVEINGEPQNAKGDVISVTSSLQKESKEDAKDIEMDTTDNETNTESEPAKEITEQNEVDEVTANQQVDNKKEQSTTVYALPNKTRNTDKLQDHSMRKSTAYDEIDYTDKNHSDGKSSIPVYAKPYRDCEEISLQSSNTTNTNKDHSEKTPEPMYAEPDNPELNTIYQVSDNLDAIPDKITPYTETVIAGENEVASPHLNGNIPPYSVLNKQKVSQVSASDTDPEGYSKIPKTGLSERDEDADMYEEVNIGGVEAVPETQRPTLPEGHPSLQQLPHGHSVSSSKSSGNRLDAIDEKDNPDPIEFYAESNFKPEVKQTNGNDGDGDQTKWTDNVVYVSVDD